MKNSGFVGVALSVAIVLLLLSSVSNAQGKAFCDKPIYYYSVVYMAQGICT